MDLRDFPLANLSYQLFIPLRILQQYRDSIQTHPRAGTAGHRQYRPRGGSRTVPQSHLGAESRSFRLQTVPSCHSTASCSPSDRL